jgi:hypothetical protein
VSLTEGEYKTRPYKPVLARCSGTLPGFGVSPSLLILPPRLGDRGLNASPERMAAGFVMLYPPYTWRLEV